MNDDEIDQIIDDVMGHKGDYVAGVETLAALYRGERDRIEDDR